MSYLAPSSDSFNTCLLVAPGKGTGRSEEYICNNIANIEVYI